VNGETPYADVYGAPFKCRVSEPDPTERRSTDIEFVQYSSDLKMLTAMKDIDGELLDLNAGDKVVIDDGSFSGEYEVFGEPTVIRKKRKQIGWLVDLKKFTGKEPVQ
jgi:hypothetical protein